MRFSTALEETEIKTPAGIRSPASGVTLDIFMGVVAGVALILAVLIMASGTGIGG